MPTERPQRRFWKPLRVDLYLLGEVAGPFLGGMVFFTFLFLMAQLLRLAEFLIVHGVSALTLGKLAFLMTLQFFPYSLPIAFLISILMAFGRLSSENELVALKASGFGIGRIAAPVLLFAAVIGAFSVALNMEWAPWGQRTTQDLIIRVSNTKIVSSIREGTFTSGFFDLLIFADKVDQKTGHLKHVFIYDEREAANPLTVVAREGDILPVRTGSELGAAAVMRLRDGSIHRNNPADNAYQKINFGEYRLYLKVDEGASNNVSKPTFLSQKSLLEEIRKNPPTTTDGREYRGEYWRRYSVALTPFIFVLLGIGFGTVRTRAVRAGAALVAFITLVIYWTLLTYATMAVHQGTIPPALAMELPNLVLFVGAVVAFRRSAW
jgi:lipopolysaccharide export system permease protein